jgi:phosphatidylinositol dimannoside acyltransferase
MSGGQRTSPLLGRVTDAGYGAGWALVKGLPEPFGAAVFRLIADVAWWRRGAAVRQLEANLRRIAPKDDLRQLSRQAMRSYLRYWLEVFRLPVLPPARVLADMHMIDEQRLIDALEAGNGVICALPHSGNWDHAGAWAMYRGLRLTTVAERLEPTSLFDRFVAFRQSMGMDVLALTGGGEVFLNLARRLRAGGLLCLLADRDLTAGGVEVDFFGEPARMPAGPAALAVATGAALLPTTLWYDDRGGWGARIHPAVLPPPGGDRKAKMVAMTQAMADAFAETLVEHPADWHMLQPLWVADLDPSRTREPAGTSA